MLLVKILGILICIALMASIPLGISRLLSVIFDWDFLDIIVNVFIIIIEICALGIIIVSAIILFIKGLSLILL